MLVALLRAMKPKMLDSFKGYDAQKEFLAKLKEKKTILVILNDDKNIIKEPQAKNVSDFINKEQTVVVYNFKNKKI